MIMYSNYIQKDKLSNTVNIYRWILKSMLESMVVPKSATNIKYQKGNVLF